MRQNGHVDLIGTSRAISDLKAEVERIARSDAKVLITGESGAGKEVVARAINAASPRAGQAFTPVNCAGIPETLLESELFGHVKGSFTGAYRDKPGKLEMSDNGTIFLDEIGEMTLRMQGLLLRFLETGEIQKVGAERVAKVSNVRVLTATNRNLRDLIIQGQFREDLFYRINVIHLEVPPLRDRVEDIPLLIEYFLRRFTGAAGNGNGMGSNVHSPVRAISPEAMLDAVRVQLAGQRSAGREHRRAAGRDGTTRGRSAERSSARGPDADARERKAGVRATANRRRRLVQEARPGSSVVLAGCVSRST